FFFQAEDGIRDRNVTGVQTCALPILDDQLGAARARDRGLAGGQPRLGDLRLSLHVQPDVEPLDAVEVLERAGELRLDVVDELLQIGRASCRERVWRWEGEAQEEGAEE